MGVAKKEIHERITLLVYPKFQITLIVVNLVSLAAIAAVFGGRTFATLAQLKTMIRQHEVSGAINLQQAILALSDTFVFQTLFFALAIAIISTAAVLLFTHRAAGPMIRLREDFSHMARTGEPKRIKFRDGDYFQDVPDQMNEAIDRISASSHTNRRAG